MHLNELLTAETIRVRVRAAERMEVVEQAGQLLVVSGVAEERYIAAMKRTLETLGPYMVIVPGVALLHARPEEGVRRVCMSLVTLEPPVVFGNEENDPVSLAFALGAVDNKQHVEALAALARLLEDEATLARLRACASAEEAQQIIAAAPQESQDA